MKGISFTQPIIRGLIFCMGMSLSQLSLAALNFQVTYLDASDEGFNDTTPVAASGDNSATTLGEQRKAALEYSLSLLSNTFNSSVPINILAEFDNLGGDAFAATLALAGPVSLVRNVTGGVDNQVLYPAALANKLFGGDLAPSTADIVVTFNSSIDTSAVFGENGWYYGFDARPDSILDVDFVSVAIHELMHGLGFISYLDITDGTFGCGGSDCAGATHDIYTYFVQTTDTSPQNLTDLTPDQRLTALGSVTTPGFIQWGGPLAQRVISYLNLTTNAGTNDGKPRLYAPSPPTEGSTLSHLHEDFNPGLLMEANYEGPNHDFSVGAAMLADMGWGTEVADLSLTFTSATTSQSTGLRELSLVVENLGPDTVSTGEITINMNTSSISSFSSSDSNDGNCTTEPQSVTCSLGSLGVGDRNTINLAIVFQSSLTLTTSISSTHVEIVSTNNTASTSIRGNPVLTSSSGGAVGNAFILSLMTILGMIRLGLLCRIGRVFRLHRGN